MCGTSSCVRDINVSPKAARALITIVAQQNGWGEVFERIFTRHGKPSFVQAADDRLLMTLVHVPPRYLKFERFVSASRDYTKHNEEIFLWYDSTHEPGTVKHYLTHLSSFVPLKRATEETINTLTKERNEDEDLKQFFEYVDAKDPIVLVDEKHFELCLVALRR